MSPGPREKALAYLASHHVMTLATAGTGGPWAAAVFYASDGFTLYFVSSPATRHGTAIGAQADVAAAIHEDYREWSEIKGLQLEGRAWRLGGAEQDEAQRRYARKFPVAGRDAPAAIRDALSRSAWYALVPRRVLFVDNSVSFGHRAEVEP